MGAEAKTVFDLDVRENLVKVLQGKAPKLKYGNITTEDIIAYRKRAKFLEGISDNRLAKYMSHCAQHPAYAIKSPETACLIGMANKIDDVSLKAKGEHILKELLDANSTKYDSPVDLFSTSEKLGKNQHMEKPQQYKKS